MVTLAGALVIEDAPPLYDVTTQLHIPEEVKRVYLAPQRTEVPFKREGDLIRVTVPREEGHQIFVLDV